MPATNVENISVIYTNIPSGMPKPDQDFKIDRAPMNPDTVSVPDGHVLVRSLFISVDPYMRGRMRDPKIPSYFPALKTGEPMKGGGVGEVIRSSSSSFVAGDLVTGMLPWEAYTVVSAAPGLMGLTKIDKPSLGKTPLSYYVSLLGMPGITAYIGLMEIGKPKAGETLYVSAAAGAVGQIVGQIGKILGLYVVGSAGDDAKVAYLKELGFDAAFNYKKVSSYEDALREHCPKGIDVYFENVGGKMLDAVIAVANKNARFPVCGMISQYNRPDSPEPIYNAIHILAKSLTVRGFIYTDYADKYHSDFVRDITQWISEGRMKYKEDITNGLEKAPETLVGMLAGKNHGKAVVKVADL